MTRDTTATSAALAELRAAPSILAALTRVDQLRAAARRDGAAAAPLLREAITATDQLTALAAVHAASAAGAASALEVVVPLLRSNVPFLRENAVWALADIVPPPQAAWQGAADTLLQIAAEGGFTGMLAAATLESWGGAAQTTAAAASRRPEPAAGGLRTAGLTVAQLFLHAEIDRDLLHAGEGDTGGIATLLAHLGDALLAEGSVERVLTLSRGGIALDGPPSGSPAPDINRPGHHFVAVPLPGPMLHAAEAWPLRPHARAGLRRVLAAAGRIDVLHLRMADVGSWAAAEVAAELGIPVVLTLAPDPHALVRARETAGTLTRSHFGEADYAEHLAFRVQLLRRLSEQAEHLVVFPRPDLRRDLRELLALDPDDAARRISTVPEGVSVAPLEQAAREVSAATRGEPVQPGIAAALAELDELLATLPPERRMLPLAISVGRLHRVKGTATLVEAWAGDPALAASCNLLLVGGDLARPNEDEAGQLRRIDAVVPRAAGPGRGLLLAGHRPNGTVAVWCAAARSGRPGLCGRAGVFVSASLKEEFGIAILEAMGSGLVVVAPREGGPATYVEDGVTGVLADTHNPAELAGAIGRALQLAAAPDAAARSTRARRMVSERFSIESMAAALAAVYREVALDAARHQS